MIKLIVTDVDGTLLDGHSRLTDLNKDALIECQKRNIGVILATGKSAAAIRPLIEVLGLTLPQITLNGAVIIDNYLNIINSIKVKPEDYYDLINTIRKKGYKPLIGLTNGDILYDEYDPVFTIFDIINEPIFKVESLDSDKYASNCVIISTPIKDSDPLDSFLRKKYQSKLQIIRSGEYFFDILSLCATKGNALNYVCNDLGIKKNEIAVFGDSPNDLSLFEDGYMRIAVKNSYPEVLERADFITDANYDSGLAKAIYKYILV